MGLLKDEDPQYCKVYLKKGDLYYLGSPYSHYNEIIRNRRVQLALMSVIELSWQGFHVYSPVIHHHNVITHGGPPSSWGKGSFYQEHDYNMLDRCDGLIVLKLEGWQDSVGLCDEIKRCREFKKNIWYRDPPDVRNFPSMSSDVFNNQLLGSVTIKGE